MPGFFQRLAGRTLSMGATPLVKARVSSVFEKSGAIVDSGPGPKTLHTEAAQAAQQQWNPPATELVIQEERTVVREQRVEKRALTLQDAVDRIFSTTAVQPILIPQVPVPMEKTIPIPADTAAPSDPQQSLPLTPTPFMRRLSEPAQKPEPTIRVSIGRVEVRAEFPNPAPTTPRATLPPALTLDEYRRQRDRGLR